MNRSTAPSRIDIHQLARRIAAFDERLTAWKSQPPSDIAWYPYNSLGGLYELDKLLTGEWQYLLDLIGPGPVLDLCSADGDIAFFLESQGCRVTAVDFPPTNFNRMAGIRALKDRRRSSIDIREMDLDSQFSLDREYSMAIFMGALYHLKNPFFVLETLARHTRYAILTTRIARFTPETRIDMSTAPLAYLLDERETNSDSTNFWVFSEPGLRRLLTRTHWSICRFVVLGNTEDSNPATDEGDARALCLLRSRRVRQTARLLEGWYEVVDGWRWTMQRFSAAFDEEHPAQVILSFALPQIVIDHLGPVTLSARANGEPLRSANYSDAGEHVYTDWLPSAALRTTPLVIEFALDKAIQPGECGDDREMGLIAISLECR